MRGRGSAEGGHGRRHSGGHLMVTLESPTGTVTATLLESSSTDNGEPPVDGEAPVDGPFAGTPPPRAASNAACFTAAAGTLTDGSSLA